MYATTTIERGTIQMKKIRFFRLTGIALIVLLLLTAIPVSSVLAANNVTLNKTSAAVGESVTVEGTAFTPSTDDNARLANVYFAKDSANTFQAISTVDTRELVSGGQISFDTDPVPGEFSATFAVPSVLDDGTDNENVVPGNYYIYVTVVSESGGGVEVIYAKVAFTVIGGNIAVSPASGKVNSTVTITGTDFGANTAITAKFDTANVAITPSTTSASGGFTSTFVIPETTAGTHTITVTVGTTVKTATFAVVPSLVIAPPQGQSGDVITVRGIGFAPGALITMTFNALAVTTTPAGIITDSNGTFQATFTVPASLMTAGIYQIQVSDSTNSATASFTLNVQPTATTTTTTTTTTSTTATTTTTTTPTNTAVINVNVQSGYISIGGSGYTPNSQISILLDGVKIDTVNSDGNGTVVVSPFELPGLTGGDHELVVTDGTNSDSYTYTVESTPPGVPAIVEPANGAKVKPEATFEWQAVSDITQPVTYELQIANSLNFATGTVILEIKDIEVPLYELSELQAANLVPQEEPYFYRIRAIDGAANAGTWTAPVTFYVPAASGFPSWGWYTIAGIGGVLLFGIGYLVGRRTAFYY